MVEDLKTTRGATTIEDFVLERIIKTCPMLFFY
jgi:hypothetical protein